MTYQAGAVLCGYKLIRQLGEGGMGSVWEAEHTHLGRKVAIKIVSEDADKQDEIRKRFFQEARSAAKIEHPNVVRILDFEVTDTGEPLLVMELLRGETLDERIVRDGPISLDETRSIVIQACAGLGAAHAAGVLHRDVKAENLFLVGGDNLLVKLFDFGIARQKVPPARRITGPLEIFGTPHYMSPEQMLSPDSVDERSDLYALAVCVYYALTGVLPFSGESFPAICVAVTRGEMEPASTVRHGLPESLDTFFTVALAREQADRFRDVNAFRDAFVEASNGSHDTLGALARLEGAAPVRRPRRAWAVAAMVGLFLTAGGAAFARSSGAFDHGSGLAAAIVAPATTGTEADLSAPPAVDPVMTPASGGENQSSLGDGGVLDAAFGNDASPTAHAALVAVKVGVDSPVTPAVAIAAPVPKPQAIATAHHAATTAPSAHRDGGSDAVAATIDTASTTVSTTVDTVVIAPPKEENTDVQP
ncbi:hypothetical protein BH09MYX1_BH09MYX1_00040 [soil metagenome]